MPGAQRPIRKKILDSPVHAVPFSLLGRRLTSLPREITRQRDTLPFPFRCRLIIADIVMLGALFHSMSSDFFSWQGVAPHRETRICWEWYRDGPLAGTWFV